MKINVKILWKEGIGLFLVTITGILALIFFCKWVFYPENVVCKFEHHNQKYILAVENISTWGFDDYFEETSNIPKKVTDSIYSIRYKIYRDMIISTYYETGIWVYPNNEEVNEHPTHYAINQFKAELDAEHKEEQDAQKYLNYLKCNNNGTE